jgi:hypothetical protein
LSGMPRLFPLPIINDGSPVDRRSSNKSHA